MKRLLVRDPRSGQWSDGPALDSVRSIAAEAARLRKGQQAWRRRSSEDRGHSLLALAGAIESHREALAEALFNDTGRWQESRLEVDVVLATLRRWADEGPALLAPMPPRAANVPFIEIRQRQQAYPLVGVISPWNFPLLLAMIDTIPALMAGSAVLIKPSEVTPRFIHVLRQAVAKVEELQAVFAIVVGAGDIGAALVEEVDLLCFTGSVATGRRVAEHCAARFIPAFLELGGKDPALVLADADLARAARALCWAGMVNAGQSCMSIERIYVLDTVYESFVGKLVAETSKLRLNWPDPLVGELGPIIAEAQIALVKSQFEDAYQRGARALCGGAIVEHDGGSWCQPTVLVDVQPDMRVMREETFAAILPVMRVADEQEAIARANDSEFGLSAAVFCADLAHAEDLASQLDAGAISLNDAALTSLIHGAEKQSFKLSGLGGSRMGAASIRRFLRQKAVLANPGVDDPWWF